MKAKFVLNPYLNDDEKIKQLKNWDLWGPLTLTISLSVTLAFGLKSDDEKGVLFSLVFSIFWLGGVMVTINAQLLNAAMYDILLNYLQLVLYFNLFVYLDILSFH